MAYRSAQKALRKFKNDLEYIALHPEKAPKHRILALCICLLKLVDLLDPPLLEDKSANPDILVTRDFRTGPVDFPTPELEAYANNMDKRLNELRVTSFEQFVNDVNRVEELKRLEDLHEQIEEEQARREAEAIALEQMDSVSRIRQAMSNSAKNMAASIMGATGDEIQDEKQAAELEKLHRLHMVQQYHRKAASLDHLKQERRLREAERELQMLVREKRRDIDTRTAWAEQVQYTVSAEETRKRKSIVMTERERSSSWHVAKPKGMAVGTFLNNARNARVKPE